MKVLPFYFGKSRIKAIVLGADPTNQSDHGERTELIFAFGVGQDPRYFKPILDNLNVLGLHLEDIYLVGQPLDLRKPLIQSD